MRRKEREYPELGSTVAARVADLVGDLPAIPATAQQALGLIADPSAESEELVQVLSFPDVLG
jgi:hypothetical protein